MSITTNTDFFLLDNFKLLYNGQEYSQNDLLLTYPDEIFIVYALIFCNREYETFEEQKPYVLTTRNYTIASEYPEIFQKNRFNPMFFKDIVMVTTTKSKLQTLQPIQIESLKYFKKTYGNELYDLNPIGLNYYITKEQYDVLINDTRRLKICLVNQTTSTVLESFIGRDNMSRKAIIDTLIFINFKTPSRLANFGKKKYTISKMTFIKKYMKLGNSRKRAIAKYNKYINK